jgi:hypothetical protein
MSASLQLAPKLPGFRLHRTDLAQSLAPSGPLECNLIDEIHRTTRRLRGCGEVEANFPLSLSRPGTAAFPTPCGTNPPLILFPLPAEVFMRSFRSGGTLIPTAGQPNESLMTGNLKVAGSTKTRGTLAPQPGNGRERRSHAGPALIPRIGTGLSGKSGENAS